MLGSTGVSASSTTQHCVTPSTSEAEYVAMAHGAKTALAIKVVLDFVQPHLSGGAIDMRITRGQSHWLKIPRVPTVAST